MSLSLTDGTPIARIISGKYKDKLIFIDGDESADGPHYAKIDLKKSKLEPIINPDQRGVYVVGGPSGSGKSTYAAVLAKSFKKIHPKKDIYFFSRTDVKDDPAYKKIKPIQVKIDETILNDPILIEDIDKGSLLIFDDVNTIHDKKIKGEVLHLIQDVLEVGRKMNLSIIITTHLINPVEKAFARTMLNEVQYLTFFPRGSSAFQIRYVLTSYFGADKKQIDEILKLPSRWVTISKLYPPVIMYDGGCYTL